MIMRQRVVEGSRKVLGHVVQVKQSTRRWISEWPAQQCNAHSDTKRHLLVLGQPVLITLASCVGRELPVFLLKLFEIRESR